MTTTDRFLIPDAVIQQALDAAFPGLPAGVELDEARRRVEAALQVAYAELAKHGVAEQVVGRVFAHLVTMENVLPLAVERAVNSAVAMRPGQSVVLDPGDPAHPMRRAWVFEQVGRLVRA